MLKKMLKNPDDWYRVYMPIFAMVSFAIVTTYTVDFLFIRHLTGYWYFATYTLYSLVIMLCVLMGAVEVFKISVGKSGVEAELQGEENDESEASKLTKEEIENGEV